MKTSYDIQKSLICDIGGLLLVQEKTIFFMMAHIHTYNSHVSSSIEGLLVLCSPCKQNLFLRYMCFEPYYTT